LPVDATGDHRAVHSGATGTQMLQVNLPVFWS
jgi:hypothetical protein